MFIFGKKSRKIIADVCRKVVDRLSDGVIIIDDKQNILLYNDSASRIFGYSADEILGKGLNTLLPERVHANHEIAVKAFGGGQEQSRTMGKGNQQIYGLRKNGSEFVSNTMIMNVRIGLKSYSIAIVRDISENKKTEEELLRLAATDPLTGAFNRREFKSLSEQERMRSQRYGRPLSILMMDLDKFKVINDTHGHAVGDEALKHFTLMCTNALRNVDVFGRWGGEEFVVLLPETDIEGAAIIAERIRKAVSESTFIAEGKTLSISVSIGVAQYKEGEISVDMPLARADEGVYEAKEAGRDRIAVVE